MENPWEYNGFKFFFLAPLELSQATQLIYPGLTEVQRQARKKGCDWEYANLLKEIEVNISSLTLLYKEDVYAGFIISKSIFEGFPNKHYYKVVVIYVEPKFRDFGGSAYNACEEYVTARAYDLNCHGLWHEYFREGHTPRLIKLGYKVKTITAVKEF